MTTYAKVIADSVSALDGTRLTTLEVRFHRFVLAEFNTHRVFSRNSASSRAIPVKKQLDRLANDPALPVVWPAEQKGMQGGEPLDDETVAEIERAWIEARDTSVGLAVWLVEKGLHKSVVNRLLEPFMWHTVVVTSTAYENFLAQRANALAQPEIRVAAELMLNAIEDSKPEEIGLGEWHRPYLDSDTLTEIYLEHDTTTAEQTAAEVSSARCARTSYLTQSGVRDYHEDLNLYGRLTSASPEHWSPLEHPATPWPENRQEGSISFTERGDEVTVSLGHLPRIGNLLGWRSLRTTVEAKRGVVTFR